MDNEKIKKCITELIEAIGENPIREGLKDTPARVAKMMNEMLEGIQYSNEDIANMFGKTFDCTTNNMVVVKDIECFSFCEHHLALMYNVKIDIGYIPKGKVIGLSKIPRIAQMCCKRLQLQERIGEDIAKVIQLATGSDNVIVKITANHSCVTARGIKSNSKTTTLTTKGIFNNAQNINSFFNTINM